MNKIANIEYCKNLSDSIQFVDENVKKCPKYKILYNMDCFNINSGYTDNELVKENDITLRDRKVNHGILYGDWEVKKNIYNLPIIVCNICNNLLYTPNEDITFNLNIIYYYKNAGNDKISSGFTISTFTHSVSDEKTSLKTVTINLRSVQENIQSVEIHVDQQPVDTNYDYNIVTKNLDKIDSTKFSMTDTSFKINFDILNEDETILGLQCELYTNITCDNFLIDNVNAEIVESGNISNPYKTITKTFNAENNITTFSAVLEHNIIDSGYNLKYFWVCYHLYYENVFDKHIYVISTSRSNSGIELTQLIENA
jgi:hypothetical protein